MQLKTMEMSEAWPDIYDGGIYTSIPTLNHSENSLATAQALKYPPMEHLSHDHKNHCNQH